MMTDEVLDWLTQVKLSGSSYAEAYECLRSELLEFYANSNGMSKRTEMILWDLTVRMGDWLTVIGKLA